MPRSPVELAAVHELLWKSSTLFAAWLETDGTIVSANPAFESWAGGPLSGTPLSALVAERQRWALKRALEAADGAWASVELCFQDGGEHPPQDRCLRLLRDDADGFLAVAEPAIDQADRLVREMLGLRDDLIEAQQQLARRQRELECSQAEAAEAMERVRRLESIMLAGLTSPDLEGVLHTLLVIARDAFTADRAAVLLLDEAGSHLTASAAIGLHEEVRSGIRVPLGRGIAGRIASTRKGRLVHDLSASDAVSPYLQEGGGSLLGVPLVLEDEVIGVLHVSALQTDRYTEDDLRLLERVGERAALAIGHAQLRERERAVAETLQSSLLPDRLPALESIGLCARYRSRSRGVHVGGDFYDAVLLDDGRLAVAIGDVAGKGLEAASTMGRLRNTLRVYAVEGVGPAETLARLDRLVVEEDAMATALLAVIEPGTGRMVYANAGHPPPLRLPEGAEPSWLVGGLSPPLGTQWGERGEAEAVLTPGERLLFYTDGIVERREERIDIGLERLRAESATQPAEAGLEALCDHLVERLAHPGAGFEDDVALLAVQLQR
jgi:hypothetical protein